MFLICSDRRGRPGDSAAVERRRNVLVFQTDATPPEAGGQPAAPARPPRPSRAAETGAGTAVKDGIGPVRRGRGALTNRAGRFEPAQRVAVDDGWDALDAPDAFSTTITMEKPKTVIARNDSPDIGFDRSINPYRGCEHGCVYCFARPTHAFVGLSPGLDFESRLFVKQGAAERLEAELCARSYKPRTIALGTSTDPYQPIERQHRVTRSILEVLARCNHPVGIVTKSASVTRDIDLLAPMAAKGLVKVAVSVTTLQADLARTLEPRASTPAKRLDAIAKLTEAGIPVTVMVAPIIPAVNDDEIETILTRAHAMGAREAGYVMLRLPLEVRELFKEWLLAHLPDRLRHVMSLVQSTRDGKDYDATWGKRMTGTGPYAWMVGRRFEVASEKLGFPKVRSKLRTDLFMRPVPKGGQLDLFA